MNQSPYNTIPYSSKVNRGRHIDRLATIAHLVGLKSAPLATARVLEIGCSTGEHLFPLAYEFPQGEFVGIDPSSEQIAQADRTKETLAQANVRFKSIGVEALPDSLGTFDYILCHGVYSWVPEATRIAVLEKIRTHLKPNGIAYISYNTYPGWHLRESIRQMLNYYDDLTLPTSERIAKARNVVSQMLASTEYDYERPYSVMLHKELTRIQGERDQYLLHEFLAPDNHAFHFHEFERALNEHILRCIGDARFSRMSMNRLLTADIPPLAFKNVLRLSSDNTSLEQTMDFLFFNVFRESLVVHAEATPSQEISPEAIRALAFSSYLRPLGEKPILIDGETQEFEDLRGITISTGNPYLKAAIRVLQEASPQYVGFAKLLEGVVQKTKHLENVVEPVEILTSALLEWAQKEVVEISLYPPRSAPMVYAHAKTAPFIQESAKRGQVITNLFYNVVEIGTLERELLQLLDGEHDRESLIQRAEYLLKQGAGGIMEDGHPVTDTGRQRELLMQLIDSTLDTLRRACLLLP